MGRREVFFYILHCFSVGGGNESGCVTFLLRPHEVNSIT
ncbi:hypothetical protein CLERM_433 [Coxiella-like endosymbiont]|nr:hypothetical protein CLERM_433 [Coxiella-like endosymbiont]